MSVEFRQRTPAEYAQMLWKHKLLIALPTLAIALAVGYVVWRLPSIYQSSSLLIVRPPTISQNIVKSLDEADLSLRITTIGQVVTSRTSLEPMILKYNLYAQERQRDVPIETLVERMQTKDIKVEIERDSENKQNAFSISFRGRDPRTTKAVTEELAGKYVSGQTNESTNNALGTRQFFETQLNESKSELDAIDQRRFDFMRRSVGSLPSEAQSLMTQLEGLRNQEKTLTVEIGRLSDQRTALSNNLSLVARQRTQDIENVEDATTDPTTTFAYAELVKRSSDLKSQLQNMLTTLKPKNPEVVAKRNEIAEVERDMQRMKDDAQKRVEVKRGRLSSGVDVSSETIRTNLQLTISELARQQRQLAQTSAQINQIEARLNNVPGTTVALEVMDREYSTKKVLYDDLLKKKAEADQSATAAVNSQGETIQVIDPANLPEAPVAPKRQILMAMGLLLGLGVGVLLAAMREAPRLLTVQTTQDAEHYTGLPVLMSVPQMLTDGEQRSLRVRRTIFAAAAVMIAVVCVPALIILLRLTRVFELISGIS